MNAKALMFGLAVAAAAGAMLYGSLLDKLVPRITSAVLVEPPWIASAGGKMTIRYKADSPTTCPVDVDVAITLVRTGAVVWRHRGLATRVSADWHAQVNIPPLPPEQYLYHTTFRALCSETRTYSAEAPAVRFEVRK